ncbi:GTPase [Arenibacter sp. F20364]|uniref:GTPase n=1 Tax=Arenibacter sp. F20364 TaxID=2926415 RepID=UPI001FF63EC9|nr:GTPase [Arenibacter sp. F20364]MCK0189484.1 GTPase [Arenibacter sp. F20364]
MGNIKAEKLVFVYNANSGMGNALLDSVHKTLSPSTYDCNLCAITFGVFSENKKWKVFRQNAGLEMEFLHKDEFEIRYPSERENKQSLPKVFILKKGQLQEFLLREEINDMKSQEDLILAVQARLS